MYGGRGGPICGVGRSDLRPSNIIPTNLSVDLEFCSRSLLSRFSSCCWSILSLCSRCCCCSSAQRFCLSCISCIITLCSSDQDCRARSYPDLGLSTFLSIEEVCLHNCQCNSKCRNVYNKERSCTCGSVMLTFCSSELTCSSVLRFCELGNTITRQGRSLIQI